MVGAVQAGKAFPGYHNESPHVRRGQVGWAVRLIQEFFQAGYGCQADEVQPQIPPTLLDKRLVHHKVK